MSELLRGTTSLNLFYPLKSKSDSRVELLREVKVTKNLSKIQYFDFSAGHKYLLKKLGVAAYLRELPTTRSFD